MKSSAVEYKSEAEIERIKESAEILGRAHGEVAKLIGPGVKTSQLDKVAETYIRDNGGVPSFKGYNDFPGTLCISVNEEVVHGFPRDSELKDGDIVSVDCGVFYNQFHSDCAYTYPIGEVDEGTLRLLRVTRDSLYKGIEQAKNGRRLGDIGHAVQSYCESYGFSVVRELVGHGVGRSLHEAPDVKNYGSPGDGKKLKPGLVIAIEPMINMGTRKIVELNDGWTIVTRDRQPSAHFEHTVAVLADRTEILTTHKYIEQIVKF